jgi:hypothetical protein
MNQNVILITAGAQLLALTIVLFGGRLPAMWTRGALLIASLVSVVCAGYALAQVTDGASPIQWVNKGWFAFDTVSVFSVSLRAGAWECLVWLALGGFFIIYDYKSLATPRPYRQGQAIARCLLALGTVLCALSGNFITYFSGAAINAFALFLGIALEGDDRRDGALTTAGAAFRYFGLVFCGLLLLFVGMLGLGAGAGSLPFELLAAASSTSILPTWAVTTLFALGAMATGMQLPVLCLPRYLGTVRGLGPLLLIVGQVLMTPILPLKLYGYLSAEPLFHYFAILPALTCLFAAFYAVSERRPGNLGGWLSAYASGSAFMVAFQGGYQSALLGSLASAVALMIMATALESDLVAEKVRKPFLLVGALAFMGVPLSTMGQSRIQEYAAVGMLAQEGLSASWLVLSLKVVADLLVSVACWRIVLMEPWLQPSGRTPRQREQESVWRSAVPLGLLSLFCLSIVMGGRPLSGILGEVESSIDPRLVWFERLVTAPGSSDVPTSDQELMARILLICVLAFAALFSLAWAFREQKRGQEFLESWDRVTKKLDLQRLMEFLIWDLAFSRVGRWLGRSLAKADSVAFDAVDEHAVARPFRAAARAFKTLDDRVLDRGLVEGIGKVVITLGDGVRVIQGGHLHKYILFGLVVTALALVAAVLRTGA